MDNIGYVNQIKFWCQKVLPLVYDDSLSYYEALCKFAERLNITIDTLNKIIDTINGIEEIIDDKIKEKFDEYIASGEIQQQIKDAVENEVKKYSDTVIYNSVYTNVKLAGAVGDGITDDTVAILNAYAKNHNLYFPEGEYKITQTINLESNTRFLCNGTILLDLLDSQLTPRTNGQEFKSAYRCAIMGQNVDNIEIKGLHLKGAYNPEWGYQGVQVWAEPEINQCIFLLNNCKNVTLDGITISNYSGCYNGQRIYDDQTYPFNVNVPNNGIKISRCENLKVYNFFLDGCSCEEPMFFDCKNLNIDGYYSNSEMVSDLGIWYCTGATVSNVKILTYTLGNSINIYSDNAILSHCLLMGGYSSFNQKYYSATIDISNEANVMGLTGYTTSGNNVIVDDCVMLNSGFQLWSAYTVLKKQHVNKNLLLSNISFYFGNKIYGTGSTALTQNTALMTTPNIYDSIKCVNWEINAENTVFFAMVNSDINIEFDGVRINTPDGSTLSTLINSASITTGNISFKNSSIKMNRGGLVNGTLGFVFDNCDIEWSYGIQAGVSDKNGDLKFINSSFTSLGNYTPGPNSIQCVWVPTSDNATISDVVIENSTINAPQVFKLDLGSSTNFLTADNITIRGNNFNHFGSSSRMFNAIMNVKCNTLIYSDNYLNSNTENPLTSLRNYNTLICTNNVGINTNIEVGIIRVENVNGISYVWNNVVDKISGTIKGEAGQNRVQLLPNDGYISTLENANAVFQAFKHFDSLVMRDVPSFMYPSGKSSTTGRLVMYPKIQTIIYMPITTAGENTFITGYNTGSTINWIPVYTPPTEQGG